MTIPDPRCQNKELACLLARQGCQGKLPTGEATNQSVGSAAIVSKLLRHRACHASHAVLMRW